MPCNSSFRPGGKKCRGKRLAARIHLPLICSLTIFSPPIFLCLCYSLPFTFATFFPQQLLACQNSPFANRVFLCIPLSTIFDTARWAGAFCATRAMPVRFARSARNARSARLFDSRQSLSLLVKRHEELKSSVTFGQSVGVTFSRTLHRGSHFYLLASWPHRPC